MYIFSPFSPYVAIEYIICICFKVKLYSGLPSLTTAGVPMFWSHPENQVIKNNQIAKFECFVNGSVSISVTWERDGRKVDTKSNDVKIHSNGSNNTLTLNRATVKDGGKYRCRADNGDGGIRLSNEAELISNHLAKSKHCH